MKLYAVVIRAPGREEKLYRLLTNRSDAQSYLRTCQQTTAPEHWRLAELEISGKMTDLRITE